MVMGILPLLLFSMAGRVPMVPEKPYAYTVIEDGEFLKYGVYDGSEKVRDSYEVTRKVPDGRGRYYYMRFMTIVRISSGIKPPSNYSNWQIVSVIDPVKCQTLETTGNIGTNDLETQANMGYGGLFYFHYRLDPDRRIVEYVTKSFKDSLTRTRNFIIKVNTDYPVMDIWNWRFITDRLLDLRTPGIAYQVGPEFMKDPIPTAGFYGKKGIITIKAGTFHYIEEKGVIADPYLGKLLESFISGSSLLIEDSDRRLMLMLRSPGETMVLEEISNVISLRR
jgi:hypothetical protein